jgi:hypothetical protein
VLSFSIVFAACSSKKSSSLPKKSHCDRQLYHILDNGAYNEEALFALIQGIRNSTSISENAPYLSADSQLLNMLSKIQQEYPKWYEDMRIESWVRCISQ